LGDLTKTTTGKKRRKEKKKEGTPFSTFLKRDKNLKSQKNSRPLQNHGDGKIEGKESASGQGITCGVKPVRVTADDD